MKLGSIHPDVIVLVDDGIPYRAIVVEREAGRSRVRPLRRALAPRSVKAAWVTERWRQARGHRPPSQPGWRGHRPKRNRCAPRAARMSNRRCTKVGK
jgi:hypothetical protein